MKPILSFIALHFLFMSCATSKLNNNIQWSKNNLLTWSDFKGNFVSGNYEAAIHTDIAFGKNFKGEWSIWAYFNQNNSAYIQDTSSYILQHEQYHFNISEVQARLLRKYVIEQKINMQSYQFETLFKQTKSELINTQRKYDEQTNHSLNKLIQLQWQTNIDKQLKELEVYENSIISF